MNLSNVYFTALVDIDGTLLISPTNEYQAFYAKTGYHVYSMYYTGSGLCKVKDTESGLFGFIDYHGNWAIQPQFSSANSVSDFYGEGDDAVAVVNNTKIINRKGEVIFSIKNQ